MPDQEITCRDCGSVFTFSEGEQDFYNTRNLSAPKCCKPCRAKRKTDRGTRDEHAAVCGKCGAECTVPFKPRPVEEGGRPVLCTPCFRAERGERTAA